MKKVKAEKIIKVKKNTFVEIRGEMEGKEYFNSIFCPKSEDAPKAVRKHLMDFFGEKEEDVETDYLKTFSQYIIDGGGAALEVTKPNTDIKGLIHITFKRL